MNGEALCMSAPAMVHAYDVLLHGGRLTSIRVEDPSDALTVVVDPLEGSERR